MIYLSGRIVLESLHNNIGIMLSFNCNHTRMHGHAVWAADNGCFANPDRYDDDGFLDWLARLDRQSCLFAVAPDVVGDADATRRRSLPMLPRIRQKGYQAAYVAQDGETVSGVPWNTLDALFIGGTTAWKLSQAAGDLVAAAKQRGKWCHMGRVNSYRRFRLAAVLGCDSVDGTFLAFGPDKNTPELLGWLDQVDRQGRFNYVKTRKKPDESCDGWGEVEVNNGNDE